MGLTPTLRRILVKLPLQDVQKGRISSVGHSLPGKRRSAYQRFISRGPQIPKMGRLSQPVQLLDMQREGDVFRISRRTSST